MEATSLGANRTGAAVKPKEIKLMLEAVRDLSPRVSISTLQMDIERQRYINEANAVGSIPAPQKAGKSRLRKAKATAQSPDVGIFMDKLGERIAFERTGTRLYGALITKYLALTNAGEDPMLAVTAVLGGDTPRSDNAADESETVIDTLHRIRSEELSHFRMLSDVVEELGGDPTAQTPCADVTAAASIGLMQVITDPRTTFAQCLNAILTAELTDNAGWELLAELAERSGHSDLAERFTVAIAAEQRHTAVIREWLRGLLATEAGTPAV